MLGLFPVKVKLHPEVMIKLTVNVARSVEEAVMQAEKGVALIKAAAKAAAEEAERAVIEAIGTTDPLAVPAETEGEEAVRGVEGGRVEVELVAQHDHQRTQLSHAGSVAPWRGGRRRSSGAPGPSSSPISSNALARASLVSSETLSAPAFFIILPIGAIGNSILFTSIL